MDKPTVIVLDGYIFALEVGRELRDAGYPVIIIGDNGKTMNPALYIKDVTGYMLSSPNNNPEKLLEELLVIGKNIKGLKALIGANDDYCLWLSKYSPPLSALFSFIATEKKLMTALLDKWEQYNIMGKIGIATPFTALYNQNKYHLAKLKYPVIVKPRYSQTTPDFRKMFGCKVITVKNENELGKTCMELVKNGFEPIIQENVPGLDDSQYFYGAVAKDGEVFSICLAQKLKVDPSPNGSGMIVRTTFDQKLMELGNKILSAINFSGICDIEFKRNWDTGELQFIEFNPRYGMGQGVMKLAGVTSPEMYVKLATKQVTTNLVIGKPGYYWVYLDEWLKERVLPWRNYRLRKDRNKNNTCSPFDIKDCIPEQKHMGNLFRLKAKRIFCLLHNKQ